MCVCMYVLDNLENGWIIEPKCTEFWSEKSQICSIWRQYGPLWLQIWSHWFGKLQMKQHSDLDDAPEITATEHILKIHSVVMGNKNQIHYIAMVYKH